MRHRLHLWTPVVLALLLGGCASMTAEECKLADWRRIGEQDGAQGYTDARLAEHAEACKEVGIRPDAPKWRAGWDKGVWTYCTPQVGWREGMAGHSYRGVCRGRNEEGFLQAFRAASEIRRLQNRIEQNHQELRRLQGQLAGAPNDEARRRIRERMRDIDREQSHLRSSLRFAESTAPY
jgi:hypothetical protein